MLATRCLFGILCHLERGWPGKHTRMVVTMRSERIIYIDQPTSEAVNVACWDPDEEFEVYPEGARDKRLLRSPSGSIAGFLRPSHRYLFKESNQRYKDQFWAEIIAYRVASHLGVTVPPAFVAWNGEDDKCGALIEWFLGYPNGPQEQYVPGGDYMTGLISGYERKKGEKHNFTSIQTLMTKLSEKGELEVDWRTWWCDTFLFDALIGNTDRHQDNWGLVRHGNIARMAPVFDNGTSLGHEIFIQGMAKFDDTARLNRYIECGKHHVRWNEGDDRMQHAAMIKKLCQTDPKLQKHINDKLSAFNLDAVRATIRDMIDFDVPVPLELARVNFINRLIEARYRMLIEACHV